MYLHDFSLLEDADLFINVNLAQDGVSTKRFITPHSLVNLTKDELGFDYKTEMITLLNGFFTDLLEVSISRDGKGMERIRKGLGECAFISLGYGQTKYGKGMGEQKLLDLLMSIRGSEAFESGLIKDISDVTLYTEGIGNDMMSDLLGNLLLPILSKIMVNHLDGISRQHGENDLFKPYKRPKKILAYNVNESIWEETEVTVFRIYDGEFIFVPESFCKVEYQTEYVMTEVFDEEIAPIINDIISSDGNTKPKYRKETLHFIREEISGQGRKYEDESSSVSKREFLQIVSYLYSLGKLK